MAALLRLTLGLKACRRFGNVLIENVIHVVEISSAKRGYKNGGIYDVEDGHLGGVFEDVFVSGVLDLCE